MDTFLRACALSLAGLAVWGSSHAATFSSLGTLSPGDTGGAYVPVTGEFDHVYTFDITQPLDFFATAVEIELADFFDIQNGTFRMDLFENDAGTHTLLQTDSAQGVYTGDQAVRLEVQAALGIGSYYFVVAGHANSDFGTGAYAYSYGTAAPVPEPEAWALMLVGLGFIGHVARRGRLRPRSERA